MTFRRLARGRSLIEQGRRTLAFIPIALTLLACGSSDGSPDVTAGPLGSSEVTSVGTSQVVGEPVVFSLPIAKNAGEEPAVVERIEPVDPPEGLELVETRIGGNDRRENLTGDTRWPSSDYTDLHAADGYRVDPATQASGKYGAQLVFVFRAQRPGRYAFKRVAVDYRVGDDRRRAELRNGFAVCYRVVGAPRRVVPPRRGSSGLQRARSKGGENSAAAPRGGMSAESTSILVAEDDPSVRTFLADNLTADGYVLHVAETVRDAVRVLEYKQPDLAILDVGLPDGSGLDLLRRVRAADPSASRLDRDVPVLMLTGRAGELDRIRGFECGADDFVAKPFSYGELRGRVEAVLRRTRVRVCGGRLRVGELEVDPLSREVHLRGERIELSQKEFALLRALATEPTRVLHKDDLLRDVWGYQSKGATRTLDSHACRLRRKLARDGDRYIVNVWGVGYRLLDGAVPA